MYPVLGLGHDHRTWAWLPGKGAIWVSCPFDCPNRPEPLSASQWIVHYVVQFFTNNLRVTNILITNILLSICNLFFIFLLQIVFLNQSVIFFFKFHLLKILSTYDVPITHAEFTIYTISVFSFVHLFTCVFPHLKFQQWIVQLRVSDLLKRRWNDIEIIFSIFTFEWPWQILSRRSKRHGTPK